MTGTCKKCNGKVVEVGFDCWTNEEGNYIEEYQFLCDNDGIVAIYKVDGKIDTKDSEVFI